jgi:hypothetical protein
LKYFEELQRRNVFRVATGYVVSSWLLAWPEQQLRRWSAAGLDWRNEPAFVELLSDLKDEADQP